MGEQRDDVKRHELTGVLWREYDFVGEDGVPRTYRIERPVALHTVPEGTTHRVEDADGVVHIVPAPGHAGCVLRYAKEDGLPKVHF